MMAAFALHSVIEGAAMSSVKGEGRNLFFLVFSLVGHQLSDSFTIVRSGHTPRFG